MTSQFNRIQQLRKKVPIEDRELLKAAAEAIKAGTLSAQAASEIIRKVEAGLSSGPLRSTWRMTLAGAAVAAQVKMTVDDDGRKHYSHRELTLTHRNEIERHFGTTFSADPNKWSEAEREMLQFILRNS